MKQLFILFSANLMIFVQSCSQNSNSNCPDPINNALGTYYTWAQGTSGVTIDNSFFDSPISVEIKNSISCDYVDIKLMGVATGTLRAKLQTSVPGFGDTFTIADGQNYTAGGITFRTYNTGVLTVRNTELTLGVNASSASGSSVLGNLAYNLRK
jgi:hypothetical protein